MFEHYTEHARRVIFFARYEASQFGSNFIEPEHLLLALLREDAELRNRIDPERTRALIEAHTPPAEKISVSVDLPLSNRAKCVLAYASEETERLGHRHLGTRHLLLGLLREDRSFAHEVLQQFGISLAETRAGMAAQKLSEADPRQPVQTLGLDRLAALELKMQVVADSQQDLREKIRELTATVLELHEKLDRLLEEEL
jgi:ATP-dependent Clp protease ATP-binding subunit ClpC